MVGQTAVVTGATSGIGLVVARSLAEARAFMVGVGRSSEGNKAAREKILTGFPDTRVT